MNPEWFIITAGVLGALMFPAGGTDINGTGYKFIRRELLPLCWAGLALLAGIEIWRCLAMAIAFDVVFRLPYGDRTSSWMRFLVFMAYPLPSLFLGFNIWQVFAGGLCFLFWVLSNWKPTERAFSWVVSCLLIGSILGITVGQLIAQTY